MLPASDEVTTARINEIEICADLAEDYGSWDLACALRERSRRIRVGLSDAEAPEGPRRGIRTIKTDLV